MHRPLKRRPPGGIEIPKPPKQELLKPASDRMSVIKREGLLKKVSKLGKMGKLGIAGSIIQAADWVRWQTEQKKRRKAGYGPGEDGGVL
jgi:hypothetical protein